MKRSIILAAVLQLVDADWQFKSRPDLSPPRLNITIPAAGNIEKGYIFVSPFAGYSDTATEQHGPRQAGPYIFCDNGDLVWSGYGIYSIWATNFQAAKWKGEDVLFSFEGDHNAGYGHGHGHTTIMNKHYETVRELRAGNHKLTDKHEFHVVSDTTAVIQVYQPVPRDLSPWGASAEQQWVVNAIFQELDIETGELLFEWSSLDHVYPDGSSSFPLQQHSHLHKTSQKLFFPSTQAKQAQGTTPLTLGTTFTSTASTRTLMATTSSPPVTPVLYTRSMGLTALLSGV